MSLSSIEDKIKAIASAIEQAVVGNTNILASLATAKQHLEDFVIQHAASFAAAKLETVFPKLNEANVAADITVVGEAAVTAATASPLV